MYKKSHENYCCAINEEKDKKKELKQTNKVQKVDDEKKRV